MLSYIKNYVITVVSIFLSLGIGIYVGYIIGFQNNILEIDEELVNFIEKHISYLQYENMQLRNELLKNITVVSNIKDDIKEYEDNLETGINIDKLVNIKIIFISYEGDFNQLNSILNLEKIVQNNIRKINIKKELENKIEEILKNNSMLLYRGADENILNFLIESYIKQFFYNEIIDKSDFKIKRFNDSNNFIKEKVNLVIFFKNSKNNLNLKERIAERILVKLCKQNNIPIIVIQNYVIKNKSHIIKNEFIDSR